MSRQPPHSLTLTQNMEGRRELPVGSELMIAAALGGAGWWVIVRAIMWLTS